MSKRIVFSREFKIEAVHPRADQIALVAQVDPLSEPRIAERLACGVCTYTSRPRDRITSSALLLRTTPGRIR